MRTVHPPAFHEKLANALEPIRQGIVAQVIFQLFETGIYDCLETSPAAPATIADRLGLDVTRLESLVDYCIVEDLIVDYNGALRATDRLRAFAEFRPWFELLVGGYGRTALEIGSVLANGALYCSRNTTLVGKGSTGISQFDTIPIVRKLLHDIDDFDLLVDVGCADAAYIIDLCRSRPALQAIGIEPNRAAAISAKARIEDAGLSQRASVEITDFQTYLQSDATPSPAVSRPACYLMAFVLQEMVAQAGISAVTTTLRRLAEGPAKYVVVIEVDYRRRDQVLLGGLGRAYYNPYFLFHRFTKQQLLPREQWEKLFLDAGFRIRDTAQPDLGVDPTRLEVGYLLSAV